MKLKYVIAIALVAFALGVFLPTRCGDSDVAYWRGRSEQTLKDLKIVEKRFKEAVKQDKKLQEKKDKRIAELEVEIAKDDQRIVYIERDIVVTREMLMASGLYKGLVKELDEKWASKYATLEGKLGKKDEQLKEWEEKFDSKVNIAIKAYIDKDLKQQEAIEVFQTRCVVLERKLKVSKFWGAIGKGFTLYHGSKAGYEFLRGRI